MVSIEDLYELIHGLFKEPIIGPLRFKMTEIRHLENSESPHLNEKFRPAIYMNIILRLGLPCLFLSVLHMQFVNNPSHG